MYFDFELGDEAAAEDALANAATIVEEVRNNRLIPNAMEPRAALAEYDPIDEAYTLFTTSQNPHLTRLVIGAFMLSIPVKVPRCGTRCGRWLRVENLCLSGRGCLYLGIKEAAASNQMDC